MCLNLRQLRVIVVAWVLFTVVPLLHSQQQVSCWNGCKALNFVWTGGNTIVQHEIANCVQIMPIREATGSQSLKCLSMGRSTPTRNRIGVGICSNMTATPQEGLVTEGQGGEWDGSEILKTCRTDHGGTEPPPEP